MEPIRLKIFTLLWVFLPCTVLAQEVLTGLQFNEAQKLTASSLDPALKLKELSGIRLPFFDDFSTSNIIPDQHLWIDRHVFVNKDFPLYPPNIGAATFDVLDETGAVYNHAISVPFIADYLTSKPIRLDSLFSPIARKLRPSDSVYLSFYYQPQGRGDSPETADSLVLQLGYPTGDTVFSGRIDSVTVLVDDYLTDNDLEFLAIGDTIYAPPGCNEDMYLINFQMLSWGDYVTIPCDSVMIPEIAWRPAWASAGISLTDFVDSTGRYFKQVMIPVVDTIFFTDNFQFRFYNYGSIASQVTPQKRSNVDQWNVDFVYLNYNRNRFDTAYEAITFSGRPPSFLRRYESMPYRQYRSDAFNAITPEFEVLITNMDAIERNTKYRYKVEQVNGSQRNGYDGGSCNLPPFATFGFQNCISGCGAAHACPPVVELFSLDFDRDTTSYFITHYVSDSSGSNILVDSMKFRQGFYNYFAYDDGTPEFGYGLEPARAMLAVQFRLVTMDTLSGVQLYFNRTLKDANYRFFDIVVWNENNGKPGEEIYRQRRQRPVWNDQLYGFHLYDFDEPLVLNGIFYVGLQQDEGGSMNLGFDAVNNSAEYIFYNVDDEWKSSDFEGSLMIRPVFGDPYLIGVDEKQPGDHPSVKLFPNPVSSKVSIRIESGALWQADEIFIFDLKGQTVFKTNFRDELDLSGLPQGAYLMRIAGKDGLQLYTKFIKSH
jgi:hypothetical protein